jgi:hypothetical protein
VKDDLRRDVVNGVLGYFADREGAGLFPDREEQAILFGLRA